MCGPHCGPKHFQISSSAGPTWGTPPGGPPLAAKWQATNYHLFNNLNYVTGITYLIPVIAIVIRYISETSVAQVPAIALYKKLGYQCASIYLDTKNMLKNSIFIAVGISLVACYKKL